MKTPRFLQKIRDRIEFVISLVMFTFVYIFGIGLTSIVAKLTKHRFLAHVFPTHSSWQKPTGSQKLERMY
jgi:hypothetical protein